MKYFLFFVIILFSCRTVKKSSSYQKQVVDSTVRSKTDNVKIVTDNSKIVTEKSELKDGEFLVTMEYDSGVTISKIDTTKTGSDILDFFKVLAKDNLKKVTVEGKIKNNTTTTTTQQNDKTDSTATKEKKNISTHKEDIVHVKNKEVTGMSIGLKVGLCLFIVILIIGIAYKLFKKYNIWGWIISKFLG